MLGEGSRDRNGSLSGRGGRGSEYNEAPLFAFADVGIKLKRLAKRHPDRRCEALFDSRGPEHEDVDSGGGELTDEAIGNWGSGEPAKSCPNSM